jgi:hypothetical protein
LLGTLLAQPGRFIVRSGSRAKRRHPFLQLNLIKHHSGGSSNEPSLEDEKTEGWIIRGYTTPAQG